MFGRFCDLFEPTSAGDPSAKLDGAMNLRGLISEAEPQRQGRRLPDTFHEEVELLGLVKQEALDHIAQLPEMRGYDTVVNKMCAEIADNMKDPKDAIADVKAASDILKGIGTGVASAIPKFQKGDAKSVGSGVCDIVGSLSQVMLLSKNPKFKAAGIVMEALSSLTGGILGSLVATPPSVESVVTRLVTDIVGKMLHEQTYDELKSLVRGKEKEMQFRLEVLKTMSDAGVKNNHTLPPLIRDALAGDLMNFLKDGMELSEQILFYIDRDSGADNDQKLRDVLVLYECWGKLTMLRAHLLTHMASLLGMRGGDKHLQEAALKALQDVNATIIFRMKALGDPPTQTTRVELYKRTMLGKFEGKTDVVREYFEQLREKFGGGRFPGFFGMICNKDTKACLYMGGFGGRPDSDLAGAAIVVEAKDQGRLPRNGFLSAFFLKTIQLPFLAPSNSRCVFSRGIGASSVWLRLVTCIWLKRINLARGFG